MSSVNDEHPMSTATTTNNRSQWRWTLAGVVIGTVFLWFALREADFAAALQALRKGNTGWAMVVLTAAIAFMTIKTWRWSVILRPLLSHDFNRLQRVVYIGTAANLVIAHTGELLRATLLSRRASVAPSAVLATIALERVFDFIALVLLIGLALVIDPRVSSLLWSAGLISLAFIVVGLGIALAFLNPTPRLLILAQRLLRLVPQRLRPWVSRQMQRATNGLGVLRDRGTVLKLLALSLLQWGWIVLAVWACAMTAGVSIPVSGAIAVFVLTVIGLTLPSAPAQVGTIQLAFVVGFELIGADPAAAFAASVVYTCFVNVAMMLIGAGCWFVSNLAPAPRNRASSSN